MSPEGKTALVAVGGAAIVGGALYFLWPSITAGSYPIPYPQDASQAQEALIQIDVAWWQQWYGEGFARNPDGTPVENGTMAALHAEASKIRAQFPGAGPATGYSCSQLRQMGQLPASFPCPAGT